MLIHKDEILKSDLRNFLLYIRYRAFLEYSACTSFLSRAA